MGLQFHSLLLEEFQSLLGGISPPTQFVNVTVSRLVNNGDRYLSASFLERNLCRVCRVHLADRLETQRKTRLLLLAPQRLQGKWCSTPPER